MVKGIIDPRTLASSDEIPCRSLMKMLMVRGRYGCSSITDSMAPNLPIQFYTASPTNANSVALASVDPHISSFVNIVTSLRKATKRNFPAA